ncbi:MAG: glycoside hydrolase family 3 C-terminal domain-containing protein, partial [Solobacterium sp.]|nr:glycoside hydrolase family 3 C-terminal domain-containing protein [Solobacterium sp.]
QELLETVAAVGKPVVVVLYGPGVFAVNWADEHANAILEAFMPGQHAAKAVADVLDGTVNPSGKLTMSVPRTTGQIPIFYNHREGSGYQSGGDASTAAIFSGGYVAGKSDPLYKFGHGLSYTEFKVSDLKTDADQIPTDGTVTVTVDVENTGDRRGADTVQLYQHFFGAHVTRPVMALAGFRKVELEPGEKKTVKFTLKLAQLGYYNEDMEFVVEPGELTLMAGDASDRIAERKTVEITGEKVNVLGRRSYICETEVL